MHHVYPMSAAANLQKRWNTERTGAWARAHLGVDAQQGAEAEEGVLLLDIVADAAQGAAPGRDEVAQVRRQLYWADPRHPTQRYGTAHDTCANVSRTCLTHLLFLSP